MSDVYKTKAKSLAGTSYHEIKRKAFGQFQDIKRLTMRKPYIRSAAKNLFYYHYTTHPTKPSGGPPGSFGIIQGELICGILN